MKRLRPKAVERMVHSLFLNRGSWTEQMAHRAPQTLTMQTFAFLLNLSGRAGGAMLLGMGLFKLGVFGSGLRMLFRQRASGSSLYGSLTHRNVQSTKRIPDLEAKQP